MQFGAVCGSDHTMNTFSRYIKLTIKLDNYCDFK